MPESAGVPPAAQGPVTQGPATQGQAPPTSLTPTIEPGLIHRLADHVIDQIAAGEVIERPASVVKELLENSLDAGAERLRVEIVGGGLEAIVVQDDGVGMSRRDAEACFGRHATSKLRDAAELVSLASLGFRGEALSSIAAVAEVQLTTRRAIDRAATRVTVAAGTIEAIEEVGAPVGTTLVVRRLFFNTPARRKFMKAPATEQAHAAEAALRVALGRGVAALEVTAQERRLIELPGGNDLLERVGAALEERRDSLTLLELHEGEASVRGAILSAERGRQDPRGLWLFVNGRYVRDRLMQRAVGDAWAELQRRGGALSLTRFPVGALWLELPGQAVDVNVHPQKLEVRFADSTRLFQTLRRAFLGSHDGPSGGAAGSSGASRRAQGGRVELAVRSFYEQARLRVGRDDGRGGVHEGRQEPDSAWGLGEAPALGSGRAWLRTGDLVVRVGAGESSGGALEVIDLTALARSEARRLFALQRAAAEVPSSTPVLPEVREVDAALVARIDAAESSLCSRGLRLEWVGPRRLALREVPTVFCDCDAAALLAGLTNAFAAPGNEGLEGALDAALSAAADTVPAPAAADAVETLLGSPSVDGAAHPLDAHTLRRLIDDRR